MILTLLMSEVIMQGVLGAIPVSSGVYPKELIDLTFWLIPVFSMVVLVFAFIFMVFSFKPKGRDSYMDEDG